MKNYFTKKSANEIQSFFVIKNLRQLNFFSNQFKMLGILLLVILFNPTKNFAQQPGDNDPTFNNYNPALIGFSSGFNNVGNNAYIRCSALQNDGKIILAGSFDSYNSEPYKVLIRLNSDGTNDYTLGGFNNQFSPDVVNSISVLDDGSIIIGGLFSNYYGGLVNSNLIKLSSSGYNDPTFNQGGSGFNGEVTSTAIQVDGKIIVGGNFSSYNGNGVNGIVRLNTNGTLDGTFLTGTGFTVGGNAGGVIALALQQDGKIVCVGNMDNYNGTVINKIARLNTDGSLDLTFGSVFGGPNNLVFSVAIQQDGKILIGGLFNSYDGLGSNGIARLNANGTLDGTFLVGTGLGLGGFTANGLSIAVQPDNKILIAGNFSDYDGTPANHLVRLNTNGNIDATLNTGSGFNSYCPSLALQPNGKIIVGGFFTSFNGDVVKRIQRINADGSIDFTFNSAIGSEYRIDKSIVLSNDQIIIGGSFKKYNNYNINYLARLNPDGDLDLTFNFLQSGLDGPVYKMEIQADGKLLVFGYFTSYNGLPCPNLIRLNINGSLDGSFTAQNIPGQVNAITLQPDNKILIIGSFNSYAGFNRNKIVRLNTNGTIDATFNPGTGIQGSPYSCDVQPNGKILIAGAISQYDGTNVNNIVRVNSNGTIDATFSIVFNDTWFISTVKQHLGNKILIAGSGNQLAGATAIIKRLNDDGSVDNTFTTQTFFPPLGGIQQHVNNITIQTNGKILAGGIFEYTTAGNIIHHNLIRLNRDGVIDSTFNVGDGANVFVASTGTQSDRKIIITGSFNTYNGASRKYIARILNPIVDATTPVVSATVNPVCKGSPTVLSVNGNLNDATDWFWYTGSCGGALVGNGATLTVSPSANETYYVRGEGGGSNPGMCATISITVNSLSSTPPQAFSNLPFGDVCAGSPVGLNTIGGTLGTGANYYWYEGGCGVGNSFATGQNINFTPTGVGVKTYYVRAQGVCNTTNCAQITINIRTAPPSSSVVVPPINNLPQYACNGTVVNFINVPLVSGASYYTWDGPAGTTFNGVANTYSSPLPFANITFGNPSGSGYYIGVQAGNACGSSLRKVQWVRNQVSVPSTIFGITEVCPGNNYSYTIVGVTGATSYTYSAPAGVLIDGNPSPFTTNSTIVALTIPAGFVSGSFCVTANTPCFTSAQRCITISSQSPIPSAITGVTSVCRGTSQTYSVAPHVGAIFNWILPQNCTGVSNSNSITVTFNNNFNGGNLGVRYTNLCNATSPIRTAALSLAVPPTPLSITGPANGLCNQNVIYTCPAQAGVTFNWTVPATSIINGGNGTNSINVTHGLLGVGTVCVTANNACGSSPQRCISIKGAPNAPTTVTPMPLAWCAPSQGINFQADVSLLTGSYALQWTWAPANAASYVMGQSSNNLVLNWNNSGAATISVTAQNACGNATRSLNVNVPNCMRVANSENDLENIDTENSLTIFPNPSSGIINVEFENTMSEPCSIEIKDVNGKSLINSSVFTTAGFNNQTIDVSHLAKGIYMIELKTSTYRKTSRIILQ